MTAGSPLWWIWVTECGLVLRGCPYFGIRPWDLRQAIFVAGVVTRTCREIRAER